MDSLVAATIEVDKRSAHLLIRIVIPRGWVRRRTAKNSYRRDLTDSTSEISAVDGAKAVCPR